MSKITALLTTLALGASGSAAIASPNRSYDPGRGAGYPEIERPRIPDPVLERDRERDRFDRDRLDRDRFDRDRLDRDRFDRDRFDRSARLDHRWQRSAIDDLGPRRYRPTWSALGAPLQLGYRDAAAIRVADRGTFTELRLQADGGRARIDRVIVQFADGTDQVAELDRVLDRRSNFVDIPLDGNNRRIDRIVVLGATGRRGGLQVFGI